MKIIKRNSVLSEHDEDEFNVGEIANEQIIVKAVVHCKSSKAMSVEGNTQVNSVWLSV